MLTRAAFKHKSITVGTAEFVQSDCGPRFIEAEPQFSAPTEPSHKHTYKHTDSAKLTLPYSALLRHKRPIYNQFFFIDITFPYKPQAPKYPVVQLTPQTKASLTDGVTVLLNLKSPLRITSILSPFNGFQAHE